MASLPDPVVLRAGAIEAVVHPWGARLWSLRLPDREGRMADCLLAPPSPDTPVALSSYFGATCGRYGNRIACGRFRLDGSWHQLTINEPPNHLHGGLEGYDRRPWRVLERGASHVVLHLHSPDGDQGYPGALDVAVTMRLRADGMDIDMQATGEQDTVVNLVNHAYWNLSGDADGTLHEHLLQTWAGAWLPVDEGLVPTGQVASVDGTPFDLRRPVPLSEAIAAMDGVGFDHCLVLSSTPDAAGLRDAVVLSHPPSGRWLRLRTDRPALQVYTGQHFGEGGTPVPGRDGRLLPRHAGIALETQEFPDAPNQPTFPDTHLHAGGHRLHRMRLTWGVQP